MAKRILIVWVACLAAAGGAYTAMTAPVRPEIAGCPVFPANNVWNTPIDTLPVDPNSNAYIQSIGPATGLHADFGAGLYNGGPIGIPYNLVPGTQPKVPIRFQYRSESDPGPYPFPPDAQIEGGQRGTGDRHVLVVDYDNCLLYETWNSHPLRNGASWVAGSGAIFDLMSNALRPDGWTSADAAGFAVLAGLVRWEEVAAGSINHALRFTVSNTRDEYIWPARHAASSDSNPNLPPMGQRFRLKPSFDISGYSPEVRVILQALKTYGMFVADNGSNWYISGVPDSRWNNDMLHDELGSIHGADFEAVDESSLMVHPDSGEAQLFP